MGESSEVGGDYNVAVSQLELEGYSRVTYQYTGDDVVALMAVCGGDRTVFYHLWKRYHVIQYAGVVQAFVARLPAPAVGFWGRPWYPTRLSPHPPGHDGVGSMAVKETVQVAITQLELEEYDWNTYALYADDVWAIGRALGQGCTAHSMKAVWQHFHGPAEWQHGEAFAAAYLNRPWAQGAGPQTVHDAVEWIL